MFVSQDCYVTGISSKYENTFYPLISSQDKIIRFRTFWKEYVILCKLTEQGDQNYMYGLLRNV